MCKIFFIYIGYIMSDKLEKLEKKLIAPSIKKVDVPKKKLESHKYKCEVGKKKYTFKTKKDLCTNLGISNKKVNTILTSGTNDGKVKISFI